MTGVGARAGGLELGGLLGDLVSCRDWKKQGQRVCGQ
jgi:hypothetical protein